MSTDEELEAALDQVYSDGNASNIVEISKLRVAFWERLVILNAGTLALSLTATSLVRTHVVGDGGVGYLRAAWKCLIFSIMSALIAQSEAISAVPGYTAHFGSMKDLSIISALSRIKACYKVNRLTQSGNRHAGVNYFGVLVS